MNETSVMRKMPTNLECFEVRSNPLRSVSVPSVPAKEYEKLKKEAEDLKEGKSFFYGMCMSAYIVIAALVLLMP